MAEFTRARSEEQKNCRMREIKAAADSLFARYPYQEITLTTIAEQLSCTRCNLYKYVTTKEEIYLDLYTDKMHAYFDALMAAFPAGCGYPLPVWAEVWAGILNAHREYLRYGSLLTTIIETNVSVDRLASFKVQYYQCAEAFNARLSGELGISAENAEELSQLVWYQATGRSGSCHSNALVEQALQKAGLTPHHVEFKQAMRDFILMCLQDAKRKSERGERNDD